MTFIDSLFHWYCHSFTGSIIDTFTGPFTGPFMGPFTAVTSLGSDPCSTQALSLFVLFMSDAQATGDNADILGDGAGTDHIRAIYRVYKGNFQ